MIGAQCDQALQEGRKVDDQVLVSLVVRAIQGIAKKAEEENKPAAGWILDGFPETSAQAQLLEKALTG